MVFDTDFVEKDGLESDEEEETVKGKIGKDLRLRQDNPTDAATSEKCIAYQSCLEQLSDLQVPQACPVKGCGVMVARQFTRKGTAFVISWVLLYYM